MKNSNSILLILVVLIAGGVIGYSVVSSNKKEDLPETKVMEDVDETSLMMDDKEVGEDEAMMEEKEDKMMADEDEVMMEGSGKYLEYDSSVLADNKDKRRVLFFYANWCPTCKPADLSFSNNEDKLPEGVVVVRVNYSDTETDAGEKALAEKYEITYQHTYVEIDAAGEVVKKWNGGALDELLTNLK